MVKATKAATVKLPTDPVLLWSNKHAAWWLGNGMGYTKDVVEAGLYYRADAEARTFNKGSYDGRIVEAAEVANDLWRRRDEWLAQQLIFGLRLLPVVKPPLASRSHRHQILPIAPPIQPVLSPENAQRVVDGLIGLGTPEARWLAEELVAMAQPSG